MKKPLSKPRPPFIVSTTDLPEDDGAPYPHSDEHLAHGRAIGRFAGLLRIGLHVERVPPGRRLSWPHAEEKEEEFVFVLEGEIDAWVDGHLHPMTKGDLAAFPAGTGICHTFINNSTADALLLVGGEANKADNRIYYPRNLARKDDLRWSRWWHDIPLARQGPHDGLPESPRKKKARRS